MRIELVYATGCPNADNTRDRLKAAMRSLEIREECLTERVDPARPSPTVLIDGVDVMGTPANSGEACRLDLPSQRHLLAVLSATDAAHSRYRFSAVVERHSRDRA